MANKYTALLLVVCLIVVASVDAISDAKRGCIDDCHANSCTLQSMLCKNYCCFVCLTVNRRETSEGELICFHVILKRFFT